MSPPEWSARLRSSLLHRGAHHQPRPQRREISRTTIEPGNLCADSSLAVGVCRIFSPSNAEGHSRVPKNIAAWRNPMPGPGRHAARAAQRASTTQARLGALPAQAVPLPRTRPSELRPRRARPLYRLTPSSTLGAQGTFPASSRRRHLVCDGRGATFMRTRRPLNTHRGRCLTAMAWSLRPATARATISNYTTNPRERLATLHTSRPNGPG